jgi:hypothetical protein
VGRLTRRAGGGLALLLAAACGPGRDEGLPAKAFVPVVIDSRLPGRTRWQTRVVVTNPGDAAATVRLQRWPPDARPAEVETYAVAAGAARAIPLRIPLFPSVSSFLFESREPLSVTASLRDRRGGGPPPLAVPVLDPRDLARPGDTLRTGPLFWDAARRSRLVLTFPASERDVVPFRARIHVVGVDGTPLATVEHAVHGVPQLIEDPWAHYGLRDRRPIYVEVTLLGGTRGRKPVWGLWVSGLVADVATGEQRFVETSLRRAGG